MIRKLVAEGPDAKEKIRRTSMNGPLENPTSLNCLRYLRYFALILGVTCPARMPLLGSC
jgi:hypothetical protein